jgi:CheY-like chemotaxis protein
MGGIEATLIIREELKQKVPIIALTSLSMKANKDKCLEVEMNDFISKPVTLEIIKSAIEKYAVKA